MNPKEIEEIISRVLQDGITFKWWSYFIFAIVVVASTFIAAYLRRKGENFATKEDFDELLKQVRKTTEETEKIKNEFYLTKATYDKYIDTVLKFFDSIYKHYRLCQKCASSTHIKFPDGTKKTTKEIWEENLDKTIEDQRFMEGYIRILLPQKCHEIISNLINSFNKYSDIIKYEPVGVETMTKLQDCFNNEIDKYKQEFENALREFLKIDQLTKT
jgi:hypothetical protein